ncbi:hypothetical protein ETH_00033965 [Eimeria tenella]|uniref:Serine-threonine/tyrosine-protein kinase catalytic domain-containing protein n=1 Tax=Eimeria tenella TaxID=5802 RepID=U6KQC2_EIMTE|nr:hypothetical protein ETH_00033965 [Eimeria tenella]CDJ39113.1 hypothetical protein ETH_00033965 [Eimeria tenella]|eukprot:XP_013229868.1 hypothetical protein ETH_00033965 [Eimeria tenella]
MRTWGTAARRTGACPSRSCRRGPLQCGTRRRVRRTKLLLLLLLQQAQQQQEPPQRSSSKKCSSSRASSAHRAGAAVAVAAAAAAAAEATRAAVAAAQRTQEEEEQQQQEQEQQQQQQHVCFILCAVLKGDGFYPASDVWSFGVAFWEALTGQIAFDGLSAGYVLVHVAAGSLQLPLPSDLLPRLRLENPQL